MAEYITREEAIEVLTGWDTEPTDMDIKWTLRQIPAADVAPVVHGRWIEKTGRAKCSACADGCWADSAMTYNYCPNCGAKMDGGADHESI